MNMRFSDEHQIIKLKGRRTLNDNTGKIQSKAAKPRLIFADNIP